MKPVEKEGPVFYGARKGGPYPIHDDQAAYFHDIWKQRSHNEIVKTVCSNTTLWQHDLTSLPGFTSAVVRYMDTLDAMMR